jgi:N4-gp56 family major capsid protein
MSPERIILRIIDCHKSCCIFSLRRPGNQVSAAGYFALIKFDAIKLKAITEDALQIDLLNSAATIRYAGDATTKATISGETNAVTEIDYADFSAMSIDLDNNRTPKDTKMFTGTRMIDTKVIPACRAMFIGSEMIPTIERMTDHFSNEAFIKTAHYGAGTKILNGEIGTIGYFRIIVVPEMMHFAGAGAEATSVNAGYLSSAGRYNVYPLLIVGSESFTTIGFKTSGKNSKFRILHKAPGLQTASSHEDPYGQIGFMSIMWWYGFMGLRTERLAIMYSVGRI